VKTKTQSVLFFLVYALLGVFFFITGCPSVQAFTMNISNDTDNLVRVQLYETGQNLRYFYCPAGTSSTVQLPNSDDIQLEVWRRYGGGDGMAWVPEVTNYTAKSTTDQTVLMCEVTRDVGAGIRWRDFTTSAGGGSSGGVLTSDEMETFKLGFWFVVSCGLFIVILGVARMISQQDHRP